MKNNHIRIIRSNQRGSDSFKRLHIRLVISAHGQRNVHAIALSFAGSDFILESGAGEQCFWILVKRDSHHVRTLVERIGNAVAVMNIHVEIQNPFAILGQHYAGQRHIVNVAKTRSKLRPGVMIPAGWIKTYISLAGQNHLRRCQRTSHSQNRVLIQSLKNRAIRATDTHF